MEKTNVMRLLEQKKIAYTPFTYDPAVVDGITVAQQIGKRAELVFKTLVSIANTGENFIFVVPVDRNLDLKKAAKAVGVKSIAMLKQKELLPLTGYIHGGCSPIGMKKPFKTVIDASAAGFDTITVSAGRVGYQAELNPKQLAEMISAGFADVTGEGEPQNAG